MRRLLIGGVLLILTGSVMAQGAKVLNAYNYLQHGELLKAKIEIEPATTHAKTGIDGKTWYYRGMIHEQIYFSEDEALKDQKAGTLIEAVKSFSKARELGSKKINMNDLNDRYRRLGAYCYQEGVNMFNVSDFNAAYDYFTTCSSVATAFDVIDSGAVFNTAIAAMRAKKYDVAIEKFKESITLNYSLEESYINLANTYKGLGNTEEYKATLAAAREAVPNSQSIITAEIDIYLASKEYDKALSNLDVAIQNDPSNSSLFFARGNILDHQQASMLADGNREEAIPVYEKALVDYKKALELKPDFFDAAYSLGALYYNRGADMINEANMITDDNKYKLAKEDSEEVLKTALPYLEKAHEIKPDDVSTMTSLKELYARTNQMEKYEVMNKKLSN
ncbi:MAG: tetratricopeptide repeat protein [Bacteroidetes bacterium]|nr:tetratricopeptide repeat protein [Bacteroidota bacterium]